MNKSSLYIHPDNQTILWDLVNSNRLFSNIPNKEEWFRNIISQFYEQMVSAKQIPTTREELLNVNKQTLKYMVSKLNEKYGVSSASTNNFALSTGGGFSPFNQSGSEYGTRNYEVYNVNEEKKKKADQDNAQFSKFEAEYHSLLKPIPPVNVDFSQPISDGKINNMEDAIKQQEKFREMDLAKYASSPPPILPNNSHNNSEKIARDALKEKIQGISANSSSVGGVAASGMFAEPKYPKNLIISPPQSENWSSFVSPSQDNYMTYTR